MTSAIRLLEIELQNAEERVLKLKHELEKLREPEVTIWAVLDGAVVSTTLSPELKTPQYVRGIAVDSGKIVVALNQLPDSGTLTRFYFTSQELAVCAERARFSEKLSRLHSDREELQLELDKLYTAQRAFRARYGDTA